MALLRTLLLLAIPLAVFAAQGVDVSDLVSTSEYNCLKQSGISFVIIRCYRSTGSPDSNCAASVNNARAAGLSVDLYMFPDPSKGGPQSQVQSLVSYIKSNGLSGKYGKIWLDIEGPQYWAGTSSNQAFFNGLVSELRSQGQNIGVYTSASQWNPIMGSSFTAGSGFPLWYAHYDNNPSFSDFSGFGGWRAPAMKQFNGDTSRCGVGIDIDWMPGNSIPDSTPGSGTGGEPTGNPGSGSGSGSGSKPSGGSGTGGKPSGGSGSGGKPSSGGSGSGSGAKPTGASGSGSTGATDASGSTDAPTGSTDASQGSTDASSQATDASSQATDASQGTDAPTQGAGTEDPSSGDSESAAITVHAGNGATIPAYGVALLVVACACVVAGVGLAVHYRRRSATAPMLSEALLPTAETSA